MRDHVMLVRMPADGGRRPVDDILLFQERKKIVHDSEEDGSVVEVGRAGWKRGGNSSGMRSTEKLRARLVASACFSFCISVNVKYVCLSTQSSATFHFNTW